MTVYPFAKFVAKKVVFYGIVTFLALNFIFFIPRLMPGDPISRFMPRGGGGPSGEKYEEMIKMYKELFGLEKPLSDQYINFWGKLFTGNLGQSISKWPMSVAEAVFPRLPYTFALVIPVLLISFFVGNWIGAKAAYMGGKRSELVYFFSVFSNRVPDFWLGMILVFLLAKSAKLFPAVGYASPGVLPSWELSYFLDLFSHYLLPFFTLLIVFLGGWATGMRSMVVHEMDSGYVRYSEQLGFRKSKLMSYAQRNAILPQFTGLNLYLSALIGETAIIETIFAWPGIGRTLFDAVWGNDYPLIIGAFLVTLVIVIIGNFLIDILYGFIDPRIRTGRGR